MKEHEPEAKTSKEREDGENKEMRRLLWQEEKCTRTKSTVRQQREEGKSKKGGNDKVKYGKEDNREKGGSLGDRKERIFGGLYKRADCTRWVQNQLIQPKNGTFVSRHTRFSALLDCKVGQRLVKVNWLVALPTHTLIYLPCIWYIWLIQIGIKPPPQKKEKRKKKPTTGRS